MTQKEALKFTNVIFGIKYRSICGFDGRKKKQTSVQGCQTDKTVSESVHLLSKSVHLAQLMPMYTDCFISNSQWQNVQVM